MWSVRVLSGQQSGQIFDLKLGKNIFGRGGSSDFKIQSLGISKEHCELHVYKDKMMIVDLKSSNGSFVNGVKIQNSLVRVGDKISLFDVIMDLIPTPDLRPRNNSKPRLPVQIQQQLTPPQPQQMQYPQSYPQQENLAYQISPHLQMNGPAQLHLVPPEAPKVVPSGFNEKVENFIENKKMAVKN